MNDVGKAMQEAIPTTLDAPDLDINAGINTAFHGGGFGSVNGFSLADIVGRLDSLSEIMVQLFDIKVVLDDGTLVGKLAPEIDRNLALLRRRGLVGAM